MRVNCFRTLPILIVSGFLAATIQPAFADPASSTFSSADPQIVRLSYVEGDVRVTRGKLADEQDAKENGTSTGWEQAVTNLPIQSGYSIVTGTGRAEIEFEDASTVYLADNSVLIFTQLTSVSGAPYTEIALLSGRATVNVHTAVEGESFKLTTPTDTISLRYPRKAVWRIDSYLDAVSITPQRDPSATAAELVSSQAKMLGAMSSYNHGVNVLRAVKVDAVASAKWDAWVAQRLASRAEAMAATMKEAGLKSPIPGLAEMKGQGHFFACAPYGTCWEPTKGWDGKGINLAEVSARSGAAAAQIAAAGQTAPAGGAKAAKPRKPSASEVYLSAHPGATLYTEDFYFPCNTFAVQDVVAIDPVTGKQKIIDSYFDLASYPNYLLTPNYQMNPTFGGRGRYRLFMLADGSDPWDWAICHSGSWIRWNHRYAWVAGRNRHYDCPVTWVRNGRNSGFVPVHPHDVPGKPPVNLKDGLMKFTGNRVQPYTRVSLQDDKPVKLLSEPPKEFRKPEVVHLENAEAPHAQAHSAFEAVLAAKAAMPSRDVPPMRGTVSAGPTVGQDSEMRNSELRSSQQRNSELRSSQTRRTETSAPGTPILFDRKSQTFSVERQVNESGRAVSILEPIGRAGNYPVNSGGTPVRGASTAYSNPGNFSQPYNGGTASQSYTPYNNGNSGNSNVRSYSPPPSYTAPSNGGGYSQPSAPMPTLPPSAPVQSFTPQSSQSGRPSAPPAAVSR
jgi:hypothetical protein